MSLQNEIYLLLKNLTNSTVTVSYLKPFTKIVFFKQWATHMNLFLKTDIKFSRRRPFKYSADSTIRSKTSNKKQHFKKKYWVQKSKITLWIIQQSSDKCIKQKNSLWDYAYRWWLKAQYKYAQSRKTNKNTQKYTFLTVKLHVCKYEIFIRLSIFQS